MLIIIFGIVAELEIVMEKWMTSLDLRRIRHDQENV